MILFHITTEANARSILRNGFEGPFFATDKRNLKSWLFAFTADQFAAGRRSQAVVLRFNVPRRQIVAEELLPDENREQFLVDPPARGLRIVKRVNVLSQGKGGGLIFDSDDEPLKFGSRRRRKTSFAVR